MAWNIVEDFDPASDQADVYVVDVDPTRSDFGADVERILKLAHSKELRERVYAHKFFDNDVFLTDSGGLACPKLAFATLRKIPFDKKASQTTFTDAYRATYYHLLGLIYSLDKSCKRIALHPLYGPYEPRLIKLWFDAMALDAAASYEKEEQDHVAITFILEDYASVLKLDPSSLLPANVLKKGIRVIKGAEIVLMRKKQFPYALPPRGSYSPKHPQDKWVSRLKFNEAALQSEKAYPLASTRFSKPYLPDLTSFYGGYISQFLRLRSPDIARLLKERTNLFLGEQDTVKGSKAYYSYETGANGVNKGVMFLSAIALNMSYEEALDFFHFCSFHLSEYNLADRFMTTVLKKHLYYSSPVYLDAAFYKETGQTLYAKKKKKADRV
jgi:hypothetical protein